LQNENRVMSGIFLKTSRLNKASMCAAGAMMLLLGGFADLPQRVQEAEKYWTDPATGYALGGYDVVSYWSPAGPSLGNADYEVQMENVTWRFSNKGNAEEFLKYSTIYVPQFSGYGAYAVSQGKSPRGNPRIWAIAHNKLYFFFSAQAKIQWQRVREKSIRRAIEQWPGLRRRIADLN